MSGADQTTQERVVDSNDRGDKHNGRNRGRINNKRRFAG